MPSCQGAWASCVKHEFCNPWITESRRHLIRIENLLI